MFLSVGNTRIRINKKKKALTIRSPKMINWSKGGGGGKGKERESICGYVHGFHGKSSAFNDGYVLLRNAIVRECLLRCHGRMPAVMGRILPNGITTGTIMAQSTRR